MNKICKKPQKFPPSKLTRYTVLQCYYNIKMLPDPTCPYMYNTHSEGMTTLFYLDGYHYVATYMILSVMVIPYLFDCILFPVVIHCKHKSITTLSYFRIDSLSTRQRIFHCTIKSSITLNVCRANELQIIL